jgi:hypothetical protein
MINKIKADSNASVEKEQKNSENYLSQLRELILVKNEI